MVPLPAVLRPRRQQTVRLSGPSALGQLAMADSPAEHATVSKESEGSRHETVPTPRVSQPVTEPDAGLSARVFGGAPAPPPVDEAAQLLSSHDLSRSVNKCYPTRDRAAGSANLRQSLRSTPRKTAGSNIFRSRARSNAVAPAGGRVSSATLDNPPVMELSRRTHSVTYPGIRTDPRCTPHFARKASVTYPNVVT